MPLRLIEIVVPSESAESLRELPDSEHVLARWDDEIGDGLLLIRALVNAQRTEDLLDALHQRFASVEQFRVMLLPVEATIPRPKDDQEPSATPAKKSIDRISREELHDDVLAGASLNWVFVAQVVLSTLVAAVGLMRNDMAVIIGAMVIAPLLGPNVAMALATTLGDTSLGRRALKTNATGFAIALAMAILIGAAFSVGLDNPSIVSRTQVGAGDIILALASGCAGVLAFTTGAPAAVIGVMVAVALLPPTTVLGMMIAEAEWQAASGALLLVSTNVICVNLAGVLTFLIQGVRPRNWWEARRAQRATRIAIATWTCLLALLALFIILATQAT